MEERLGLGHIAHVGGGAHHRVHQSGLGIDADMRLHAEMPLIAFLRLVHLLIPFPFPVLGRRRCGDQGGVDNRAFPQQKTFLGQMGVDGIEDGFGQLVRFQQAAELEQCRGIRRCFPRQVDPDKAPDGLAVVQGILDAFIRESKALLRYVHAQHPGKPNGRATTTPRTRVEGGDRALQFCPRGHRFHFRQKSVSPCLLLLRGVFQFRKTRLLRHLDYPLSLFQYFLILLLSPITGAE